MKKTAHKHARFLVFSLAALSFLAAGCSNQGNDTGSKNPEGNGTTKKETIEKEESLFIVKDNDVIITKSTGHNPICGYKGTGNYTYGGDPFVLADGDTVYLYTGHDLSDDSEVSRAVYNIPEYLCYSTTDMKE